MTLTKEYKDYLIDLGVDIQDFSKVEEAINKTTYELVNGDKITKDKVIEMLGIKSYLSGISESINNITAMRTSKDLFTPVFFNSEGIYKTELSTIQEIITLLID